jgi:hypothetical protein
LIFGPQVTVATVLEQNVAVGDEELFVEDRLVIPQLGTLVLDEGAATTETIEYSFRDPRDGSVLLVSAAANAYTAIGSTAKSYLVADASSTDTVIIVRDSNDFPTTGFPYVLLLDPGSNEEVVQATGNVTGTGDSFAFADPIVTLTDAGAAFTTSMINGLIQIAGATSSANDGIFRITGVPGGTSIAFQNPNGVAEAFTGTWTVLNAFVVSALVNNHSGPVVSFATSGFSAVSDSGSVITLDDTSNFPAEGVVRIQEDGGATSEDAIYTANDLSANQLQLRNKLLNTYTNAEVTLLREQSSVELAQVQVKGAGWDIFQTEPRVVRIFIPEALDENRLVDATYLHGPILSASSTTVVGAHSIGDVSLEVADASTFPDSGIVDIDSAADVTAYTIARFATRMVLQGVQATGSITTPAGSAYAADPPGGETFTLDDGVSTAVVFEFDQDASVSGGNTPVTMTGAETVAQMAVIIRDTINSVDAATLNITAELDPDTVGVVNLTNGAYSADGNVTIVESVSDAGFIVAGMSGGSDGDVLPVGATLLHVDDVTPIKDSEEISRDLILSRGTGSEEVVTWSSIDEAANTITLETGVTNTHTPTEATGSITTIVSANHADTETLTIDDGINTATVFEFDSNGSVTAGRVPIDITGSVSADVMRDRIIAAINSQAATLFIGAVSGGAATVTLQHRQFGTVGNETILESVTDGGFIVSGMSGGTDEGAVELNSPDFLRLNVALTGALTGGETVAVIENAYGATDLEDGRIYPVDPPTTDHLYQGSYVWELLQRIAESDKSTLNEDIAGPTELVASQRAGRTALEVKNAALFLTPDFQEVRVGRGLAGDETRQINDITLMRDISGASINSAATAGDTSIVISAASGLPEANGYRLFIDDDVSGTAEEVVLVRSFDPNTNIAVLDSTTPLANNHSVGDDIQLMADVLTVDILAYDHAGKIKIGEVTRLVPLIGGDWASGGAGALVGAPNERISQIEEVRSYIDLVDASDFTAAGGFAQINFGRNTAVVESQLAVDEAAASTTIDVVDGSDFPTADFFIHIGVGTRIIETVKAASRAGDTITLTAPASNALLYSHRAGEWVRYFPGEQEQITYDGTETGANERLTFSSGIRFAQDHLEGEAVALSGQQALPSITGTDFPFYLPSRWQDRIEFLIDLARAAGVQVIITSDR